METYRLKNIIIILLILVNAFLLYISVSGYMSRQSSQDELISSAVTLLENSGISVESELISNLAVPPALTLSRSESLELSLVRFVLGNVTRNDEGGGIYYYSNEFGNAVFRNNGSFEIIVNDKNLITDTGFAEEFCDKFGYTDISTVTAGTQTRITAIAETNGISVYNCALTFTFSGESLINVSGNYISASGDPSDDIGRVSAVTALVNLRDYCNREGRICNSINDMTVGYILQSTASVPLQLVPIWQITTDTYTYYVNSVDGSVSVA